MEGSTLVTTAAICASWQFSSRPSYYRGEQYDPNLNLYYLRARYYNPAKGRFFSRDILSGRPQMPTSQHKYLYARGDPGNKIDPRGLMAVEEGEIDTYDNLTARSLANDGLENHHLIPAGFACVFGAEEGEMLAISLSASDHQSYDNQWAWEEELAGEPCQQKIETIYEAALEIYVDDPPALAAITACFATTVALGGLD